MSTIASHIHAALSALAQNESLCAMAQDAFGAPLLFCSGSSFGQERELGFAHAPFIALLHGENEAALEIFSASLPIPRTFYLRLITGTPICTNFPGLTSPLPPIPTATQRSTPTIYAAGQGETGERLHLHAIKILTELLRSRALHVTSATCSYSGSSRFPLEIFDSTLTIESPRTLSTGAY